MVAFADRSGSEPTPTERFERLLELPPSAKLVYRVLQEDAPMTQRQLREDALLPARTTRDALAKLKERGLVEEKLYVQDARKRLYDPLPVDEPEDVPL
ncbi:winged helix-turn-helix transcriptional regulator [Halomicrococcus gelatinilyticus]|uniref:winged helix-turn-helix transcriptional regulator n=1 Tax=Halomicrococcus gelatinilyticus TaxID=1702103 RepID=UPI0038995877